MKTNSAFRGSLIFLFTAGNLLGLSSVSAQLPSPSYFLEYFATQSVVPTPQPSFTVTKRRRINNCHENWMKEIEAQGMLLPKPIVLSNAVPFTRDENLFITSMG